MNCVRAYLTGALQTSPVWHVRAVVTRIASGMAVTRCVSSLLANWATLAKALLLLTIKIVAAQIEHLDRQGIQRKIGFDVAFQTGDMLHPGLAGYRRRAGRSIEASPTIVV